MLGFFIPLNLKIGVDYSEMINLDLEVVIKMHQGQ